eukprot:4083737-Prymnesium_polylepis.1
MAAVRFTSIIIAHRLSTIRHADKIAVVQRGRVVEEGDYPQLMAIGEGGLFHSLAASQDSNMAEDEDVMAQVQQDRAQAAAKLMSGVTSVVQRLRVRNAVKKTGALAPARAPPSPESPRHTSRRPRTR